MLAATAENSLASYDELSPENLDETAAVRFMGESPAVLQVQMRDYSRSGDAHLGQRVVIYAAALALASYYYDPLISIVCLALIAFSETLDIFIHKAVFRNTATDMATVRRNFALLFVSTVLGSSNVVFYAMSIALVEKPATHFMPFFFLFAGSIFSALNDNQVLFLLRTRLALYGATFLAIPILDIVRTGAGVHSPEWNELFTSVFVLFFITEISRAFVRIYRLQLRQMVDLRDQAEKAKVASRAKSEFLSVMSHELRTPMTSINGAVGLAASGTAGPLTPGLENLLRIAQSNCRRLSNLINDILDLQKIEAGRMDFRADPIELHAFLEKSCAVNRYYANSLNVGYETASAIPGRRVVVRGDEQRLDQVMSNLLSNAAKFSGSGQVVTVGLSVHGARARIEVIDRGVGLSEDKRDLVFDKFSQIDSSDNRRIGGTGLGMNISRQIVEAHGGTVDYRRNAGPGTTFFIDLPLAED
ncbi:sensor histidine kinase [Acidimangrovimonas sediminis]|uniref:sensor histidine kinase n=1 Tax=Acidimangrovimonas sediminis TaxID=2056283 RepID=UPI000C80A0C0|nr:HAMP domain-containing sensor histidine kinase [Acidimangrovimonas sediminis]